MQQNVRDLRPPPLRNARNVMGGLHLLRTIDERTVSLVTLDPQYRAGLDQLNYGNEGARQVARAALPQMSDEVICAFVEAAERVLCPGAYLFLWTDKFGIASGRHHFHLRHAREMKVVDMIVWHKMAMGMGYRSRSSCEHLIIVQKAPQAARTTWKDHAILDCWSEKQPNGHPHAKPRGLTKRLIECVTRKGNLVVDPCAGGYGVLDACLELKREFLGSDLLP